MSVSGIEELEHKLKTMSDPNLKQAVSTGIQIVRSAAVMNCHVDMGKVFMQRFRSRIGKSLEPVGRTRNMHHT